MLRLRKAGLTYEAIAAQTDLSRTGVFDLCQRHGSRGAKALHDRIGGRQVGEHPLLTAEQERQVQRPIRDSTPDQIKLPYALWSRQAVADLIRDQFGIRVAVRTMGTYLKRWGFRPKKFMKVACQSHPTEVKAWLEQEHPAIAARAKVEDAGIHWGHETELRSDDVRARGYAPNGRTPAIRLCSNHENLSLISTVTNQATVRNWPQAGAVTLTPKRDSMIKMHLAHNDIQQLAA